MKSRVQHLSKIRGTVVAATVGVVAATLTVGVVAWPAAGGSGSAEGTAAAVTRVDPLPSGASVTRSGKPAGHALQQLKERQRKQAARLAREARQRKARAARSASRTVDYDSNPRGIASGPDGNIWLTNDNKTIAKMTTAGVVTVYADSHIFDALQITPGNGNFLWFVNGTGRIGQITTSGVVSALRTRLP